jgi:hypothetical protein
MIEDSTSKNVAGNTRKRTRGKSAEPASIDTTSKNTTEADSLKNTTEDATSKNTTEAATSKNIIEVSTSKNIIEVSTSKNITEAITSKNTTKSATDSRVVRDLVDLTLNDDNNREFNTEDYRDKSGEDSRYDTSQEIRSNFGGQDNVEDFEDYYSQIRDKDKYSHDKSQTYLTKKDFNYTMGLVNEKINSIYKLCKFIADIQQEEKNSLKKLVAMDELSDNFWGVSY